MRRCVIALTTSRRIEEHLLLSGQYYIIYNAICRELLASGALRREAPAKVRKLETCRGIRIGISEALATNPRYLPLGVGELFRKRTRLAAFLWREAWHLSSVQTLPDR